MKKKIIIIIMLSCLLLTSFIGYNVIKAHSKNNTSNIDNDKQDNVQTNVNKYSSFKAMTLYYNKGLDEGLIKSTEYNTIILSTDGSRIYNENYRPNYKITKIFDNRIKDLNELGMFYYVEITSGPGFSKDHKDYSIFKNKTKALYYSQMVSEMIKKLEKDTNFKGISININDNNILAEDYYKTLDYIVGMVREKCPDATIIYNLHPSSLESGFNYIPNIENKNIILNGQIIFSSLSYPGYGVATKSSLKINKNILLSKLNNLKNIQKAKGFKTMVTLKTPWADGSGILLQDMFEMTKMLDFDISVYSLNSNDMFCFKNNNEILKILKRNNK